MPRTTSAARRRFDSVEQEAYLNLWRTYDRLKAIEEELFDEFDLSAQQYNTLRLLQASAPSPLTVRGLSDRLISRAPDMTRLLDRLETRKLIERMRRDDNRRVVDVSITPQGLTLLADIATRVRDVHRRQLSHLSPAQLRTLVELLTLARAPHEDDESPWSVPAP